MIPSSPQVCPFYGKEKREEWHRERGIPDPLIGKLDGKTIVEVFADMVQKEDVKADKLLQQIVDPDPEKGMTKEERYRAKNKEKLAAKARERRARK